MRISLVAATSLLGAIADALPSKHTSSEPFLTQLDDSSWVFGNELWNLTQQETYGVKLMYKGKDCVGDAVGHYVSYSTCPWQPQSLDHPPCRAPSYTRKRNNKETEPDSVESSSSQH